MFYHCIQITQSCHFQSCLSCLGVSCWFWIHMSFVCACAVTVSAEGCNLAGLVLCCLQKCHVTLASISPKSNAKRLHLDVCRMLMKNRLFCTIKNVQMYHHNVFIQHQKENHYINGLISKLFLGNFDVQSDSLCGIH